MGFRKNDPKDVKKKAKDLKRADKFASCRRCPPGGFCGKHLQEMRNEASGMRGLHDDQGRNINGIRYDDDGKRIWD